MPLEDFTSGGEDSRPRPMGLVLQQALSAPQGRVEGKISVPLPPLTDY